MERERAEGAGTGADGRLALVGLLVVQIAIGYEWLSSGLTKVARSDFPGGLGHELTEKAGGGSGWYRSFLEGIVIPHAPAFGYLIEVAELVTGLGLLAAAAVWLAGRERLGRSTRLAVLATTAAGAFAGLVMNVNFHLANGSPLSPLGADSFDEAVDLDSLMAALELVLLAVSGRALISLRRGTANPSHQRTERRQRPRSGKETILVNTHVERKLPVRARSALWLLTPLVVGLALGAALFGGNGGAATAAAPRADLTRLQQDATFWRELTSVLKPAPLHLRSMQDHRLYVLPSGIILGLHFDNMNLAKAKNLNWVVFGVPGTFTKADQARVQRLYGPGFVHFHNLQADTHGGKPGAKGAWFVHIGVRDFRSPFGQVASGAIDSRFMPTPPLR